MHDLDSTLVAVATPAGRGGVGCLRISGPRAAEVALQLFRPADPGKPPRAGGRPRFGRFVDRSGSPLDHGYAVLFSADSSYTGESSAELWPHGSPAVLAELVEGAVAAGALPAGPGEFTYRALRHGRIDLARAEAVRDLVAARTLYQARIAFSQAEGAVSHSLQPLCEGLEEWIARAEAAVEFVEESETHLPAGRLERAIAESRDACAALLEGFKTGKVVRTGATLVIAGRPNAGKSSIFNSLLERNRAIVTEIAGTTRDTLEEDLDLGGIPVRLIDTAGLRPVEDPLESEGVRRAEQARAEADLVLLVLDGTRPIEAAERKALRRSLEQAERERTVVVMNKCDLEPEEGWRPPDESVLKVSALTGAGMGSLRRALRDRLLGTGPLEDPVITNARHARALEQALAALDRAESAMGAGLTEEIVAEEMRLARKELGEITGEFTGEELYDRIFSTFCIGK
jgi:tRNA modification GTPase